MPDQRGYALLHSRAILDASESIATPAQRPEAFSQEHGSVVKHFSSTTNSLHTLHLDTGYWGDPSLDRKRYFLAAGLRVQHEEKTMLVPFFIPVENKTGLTVSQEVFQPIDYIATCQAFHGSRVLGILSDQGTKFVNQEFEKHARQRGIHLPHHQHINHRATVSQRGLWVSLSNVHVVCFWLQDFQTFIGVTPCDLLQKCFVMLISEGFLTPTIPSYPISRMDA